MVFAFITYLAYGVVAAALIGGQALRHARLRRRQRETITPESLRTLRHRGNSQRALVAVLAIVGGVAIHQAGHQADLERRRSLALSSELAVLSLPAADIEALSRQPAQPDPDALTRVVHALRAVKMRDPRLNFVYLVARQQDGSLAFLADAEDPSSSEYSTPGESYPEASPELRAMFDTKRYFVEGPLRDRHGTWISAFSCVYAPSGFTMVAALGLDIPAHIWNRNVHRNQWMALGLALVLVVIALQLTWMQQWTDFARARISASEERYRRLYALQQAVLDSASQIIFSTLADGTLSTFNRAAERLLGFPAAELVGRANVTQLLDAEEIRARVQAANPQTGQVLPAEFAVLLSHSHDGIIEEREWTFVRKDGSRVPVSLTLSPNLDESGGVSGFVGVAADITERKAAAAALRRRDRLLIGAAAAGNHLLLRDEGFDAAIHGALAALGDAADADRAYIFENIAHPSTGAPGSCQRYEWTREGVAPQHDNASLPFIPNEGGFIWWQDTLARGETISGPPAAMPADLHGLLASQGIRSLLVVPIFMGARYWGFIGFDDCQQERLWSASEQSILVTAAGALGGALSRRQAGEALQRAREREIEIGFRIQSTLLQADAPSSLTGMSMAGCATPSAGIAGDFMDYVCFDNRSVDVVIGDVMGKGVPAALLGAATKNAFNRAHMDAAHALGGRRLPSPAEIVSRVNRRMVRQLIELESFVTGVYVRIDAARNTLTLVNCGHTRPALLRHTTGAVEFIDGSNMPLGFLENEHYDEHTVPVAPGDILVLYSDGVTEARHRTNADVVFGEPGLATVLASMQGAAPDAVVARIAGALADFSGSSTFADDLTCVAVAFLHVADEPLAHTVSMETRSDLNNLGACRAFLRQSLGAHPGLAAQDDVLGQIELAVVEALTNIIRHGTGGATDQPLWLEVGLGPTRCRVLVRYHGEPFAPPDVPPPDPTRLVPGGWGLYIIEQCMDRVRYGRDAEGRAFIQLDKVVEAPQTGVPA
jgi:PAS domain S-box-containing protein